VLRLERLGLRSCCKWCLGWQCYRHTDSLCLWPKD